MKLLFDQNLSHKLVAALEETFEGSSQVRLLGLDRAEDAVVWSYAAENGFVIVTQDADFADMAAMRGSPPKVVWLRCGNRPTQVIRERLGAHAREIGLLVEAANLDCLEIG